MATLQTLTLGEFQELYKVNTSDIDELDKLTEMVAILSGKTSNQVDEMPIPEFSKLAGEVTEIFSKEIPHEKPKKVLSGYHVCYEPAKLTRGQYVTVHHFMKGDVLLNAHLIIASLTYNPETLKHDGDNHAKIAEKLQECPLIDIYSSCVFFCELFRNSIQSLQSYLLLEMIMKGMSPKQAARTMEVLITSLDGFSTPNGWQNLRGSVYGKVMN